MTFAEALDQWIEGDYADVHESGQLRLGVAGDQRELLPLDDEGIPHDEDE